MAAKKSKSRSTKAIKKVAKKKASASKAGTKTTSARKTVSKTSAKKIAASSKASISKTKTATKSAKTRTKASSVDGILKRYHKERATQEAKLISVRGQIKDLTSKIQAYQKQIVKLKSQQLDTENSICTMDIRRDQEVAGLLSSLGINLDSIASAGESVGKKKVDKPTPLFDGTQASDQGSVEVTASESTNKPEVDVLIADKK